MELPKKLETWNTKKIERFEAKKRKVEALLNLFEESKDIVPKRKKEPESLIDSYKALKDVLKKYTKKTVEPFFYLTPCGVKAKVSLELNEAKIQPHAKILESLFSEDLYNLLLKSVIGHMSPYPIRWAKLEAPQIISRSILVVIEGFTISDVVANISKLSNVRDIFSDAVQIATPNISFATELSTLHQAMNFHIEGENTYSSVFPETSAVKIKMPDNIKTPSKLHLLLSPIQLVMENYPLPQNVFQFSKSENYIFTHESYSPVTKDSPLFAIDCEMCRTGSARNELTRVAIVNENHEVIYHTFVKPEAKIVDYMTRYSGITKEMLKNVTKRLKQVQIDLQAILPKDAILCGQSLNCDMHALQMIHPYVIDTSIIFNGSGIRGKKDSLKKLAMYHLNESIQTEKTGHNPIEDAITTMKLVQLKLNNTVKFGDACLDNIAKKGSNEIQNPDANKASESKLPIQTSSVCDKTSDSIDEPKAKVNNNGFFARLAKFSKKVCVIGNADSLDCYPDNMLQENVHKIIKTNVMKISKSTLKHMNNYDFTISHLVFDSNGLEDCILELNNFVKQAYDCCLDKSMFIILFSGVDKTKVNAIKNGLLLPVLKKIK